MPHDRAALCVAGGCQQGERQVCEGASPPSVPYTPRDVLPPLTRALRCLSRLRPSHAAPQVDVDECPAAAEAAGIRSVPTFRAISGGKVLREFSGANIDTLQTAVGALVAAA